MSFRMKECDLFAASVALMRHIWPYPAQSDWSSETESTLYPLLASNEEATSFGGGEEGIGLGEVIQ